MSNKNEYYYSEVFGKAFRTNYNIYKTIYSPSIEMLATQSDRLAEISNRCVALNIKISDFVNSSLSPAMLNLSLTMQEAAKSYNKVSQILNSPVHTSLLKINNDYINKITSFSKLCTIPKYHDKFINNFIQEFNRYYLSLNLDDQIHIVNYLGKTDKVDIPDVEIDIVDLELSEEVKAELSDDLYQTFESTNESNRILLKVEGFLEKYKQKYPEIYGLLNILIITLLGVLLSFYMEHYNVREKPLSTAPVYQQINNYQIYEMKNEVAYYYEVTYYDPNINELKSGWISKRSLNPLIEKK